MKSLLRPRVVRVDEDNPYWISFSDLMSALLVVFILAAVALIIELTEQKSKIEQDIVQLRQATKARKDILYEIKAELAKQKIFVEVADNDTVLRIPDTTLTFRSNSDKIPSNIQTREMVKMIGLTLHRALNKPFDEINDNLMRFSFLDTIFIEGHTDGVPARKKEKGNWGLSSFRAISLWEYWENNLSVSQPFSQMKNTSGISIFSVSGYAATRRLNLVEDTPESRAANRRIDIRFTIKQPKIAELEEIVSPPDTKGTSPVKQIVSEFKLKTP